MSIAWCPGVNASSADSYSGVINVGQRVCYALHEAIASAQRVIAERLGRQRAVHGRAHQEQGRGIGIHRVLDKTLLL